MEEKNELCEDIEIVPTRSVHFMYSSQGPAHVHEGEFCIYAY